MVLLYGGEKAETRAVLVKTVMAPISAKNAKTDSEVFLNRNEIIFRMAANIVYPNISFVYGEFLTLISIVLRADRRENERQEKAGEIMKTEKSKKIRANPHLYEANARIFLRRLSLRFGRKLTLKTVPDEIWSDFKKRGFDLIWLMGVWQRSPLARKAALDNPSLRSVYDKVLPGWTERDVAGSPYAVYSYRLAPELGEHKELPSLREKLNRMGLKMIVDFVPNHLAMDHSWTVKYPERFVRAERKKQEAYPGWFFETPGGIYLAHGRDPYFPPWTDTVQVNFFSPELRKALTDELLHISEMADGVRCDMAMLGLNEVFQRVWGPFVGGVRQPEEEFWPGVISAVKRKKPGFLFLAEVYWGLESRLQKMGFDFTYGKVLYDRLLESPPVAISDYLRLPVSELRRSAHFIENHDERRAVGAYGRERSLAAAAVIGTLPGMRFFHDGQLEGKTIQLPIQLIREPDEIPDERVANFYDSLFGFADREVFHKGRWGIGEVRRAFSEDKSFENILCWNWRYGKQVATIAINYSAGAASALIGGKIFNFKPWQVYFCMGKC